MKALADLYSDAVLLHGLCQGATIVLEAVPQERPTTATNAMIAILDNITDRVDALAEDLNALREAAA